MYWILLVMGAMVSVVTAVLVGGLLVPATFTVRRAVTLRAAPATAQAALAELAAWPVWMTLTRTPRLDGDVMQASGPGMAVGVLDDDGAEIARLTLHLARDDAGTVVHATECGRVRNPVARLLRHYGTGHHGVTDAVLRALAARVGDPDAEIRGAG